MLYPFFLNKWWWTEKWSKVKRALFGPPRFREWYDAGSAMSEMYGNTLIYWSTRMNSYPMDADPEEYRQLLRQHGEALLEWVEDLDDDPAKYERAQEVYRWTAENLATLWD